MAKELVVRGRIQEDWTIFIWWKIRAGPAVGMGVGFRALGNLMVVGGPVIE
jgi:hypothetical protein